MSPYSKKQLSIQPAELFSERTDLSSASDQRTTAAAAAATTTTATAVSLHKPKTKTKTPKRSSAKMVIFRPNADIRSTQRLEQSAELPYLEAIIRELEKALEELLARYPDLETARDYQEYLKKLSQEIESRFRFVDRPGNEESGNTPNGVFRQNAEHLNWLAESTRRVQQGQKYVHDCYQLAQAIRNSSHRPRLSVAAPAGGLFLGQEHSSPEPDSQISLARSLSRVRERLQLLESTTLSQAPRCFVPLYKKNRLGEAHLDDHVLIANTGSRVFEQEADAIEDSKLFYAVYGQCPKSPIALKYTEVFCYLYGLTPGEVRGSLRKGPVTDIINQHANYLMGTDRENAAVTAAFSNFIAEVRLWSYLPGVGSITVPEYDIDLDLARLYRALKDELSAAMATTRLISGA